MAVKYDAATSELLKRVDSLEKLYRDSFAINDDPKLLQGVERCIEIRMKLLGYDGKNSVAAPIAAETILSIDLKQLSETTLRELLAKSSTK